MDEVEIVEERITIQITPDDKMLEYIYLVNGEAVCELQVKEFIRIMGKWYHLEGL